MSFKKFSSAQDAQGKAGSDGKSTAAPPAVKSTGKPDKAATEVTPAKS